MRMCHFGTQNGLFLLNKKFWLQTIIITFIYLLALFIVQNLKKILTADPELWGHTIFGPKIVYLPQTKLFWKKSLISFSSTYWPFSLCKILKKFFQRIQSYEMQHFWDQNGPFAQMRIFSGNMLISLVPFIHAYLQVKNKSQILIYKWNIDD